MAETLGILGLGAFSRFLLPHLRDHFELKLWNRSALADGLLPAGLEQGPIEAAAGADAVMFAVPVQAFEEVLAKAAPHVKPGALVLDVASVKVRPVELMQTMLPGHCEILATHPLFGPESARNGLAGHRIVVWPVRTGRIDQVRDFLGETLALEVLERTPEDHDREMAWVQGLPHFVVRALNRMQPPQSDLTTPAYQHLRTVEALLKNDSEALFRTIQQENPYAEEVRRRFLELLAEIEDGMESR
jgi:prephenate dehydrogenase